MDRRAFLRRGAGVTLLGGVGTHAGRDGVPRRNRYRNPVFGHVFPDPTAVRAPDGRFFAYGTYHDWGDDLDRALVPIVESETLVDWRRAGAAFTDPPDWKRYVGFWAPDVGRVDGRYVLYYSDAEFGAENPGVGVATAGDPSGPFTDRGPVLRSRGVGVPNAIDPCLFVDDGAPYLFFGSHRGVYGIRLTDDGLAVDGDPFQVAGPGVEAAYVIEREGTYYLFGSRGTCCSGPDSTYRVVVGRSNALRGPYSNRAGESLLDAPGSIVVRSGETFAAPGHNAVVSDDDGNHWTLYHAYDRENWWVGDTPRRILMLSPLRWSDGWPVVPGRTPRRHGRGPSIDEATTGGTCRRPTSADDRDYAR